LRETGSGYPFVCNGSSCSGDADVKLTLLQDAEGFTLVLRDGARERYALDGRIVTETDRAGRVTTYAYDAHGLQSVTGPFGHGLVVGRTAINTSVFLPWPTSVTTPAGEVIGFDHKAPFSAIFQSIRYPDGTATVFHSENPSFISNLTGISYIDISGATTRYSTYSYDTNNNAVSTEHAGGMERFTLSYDSPTQTRVTDAANAQSTMTFETNLGVKHLVSKLNLGDGKAMEQGFDTSGNLSCRKDEEGRVTTYSYNGSSQLTGMTEGLTGTCGAPTTTSATRTTTYQYLSPTLDLPTLVSSTSVVAGQQKTTSITYGDTAHPNLPTQIVQSGFTSAGAVGSRTTSVTYNSAGQPATITGPRTDLLQQTTLGYYTCTNGGSCGQLQSATNAAGHTTTFDTYDGNGRPTQKTGPNGLKTLYTYDVKGRVLSVTEMQSTGTSRVTSYTYTPSGDPASVSFADGRTLNYLYDAARKLRRITDNLGNYISYNYELRGNRIKEYTFDPNNVLARQIDLAYDLRNHLASINLAGSTTQILNDAVGNVIQVIDPLTHTTSNQYDALNRLVKATDPNSGVARYTYDSSSRVTQVQAPNNAVTQYQHDDLGNLIREVSPDRGTTTYTYDRAGNVLTKTDGKSQTTAYAYDALNRVTSITLADGSKHVYSYDQGPNGIGRLSGIGETDSQNVVTGQLAYGYDQYGNTISDTRTINGVPYTVAYSYDGAGRLNGVVYPSGMQVAYGFDALGRIKQISVIELGNPQVIVSNVLYQPFGGVKSYTRGNYLTYTREYDLAGRIASYTLGNQIFALGYDAASRITFIADTANLPNSNTYAYDNLDRLTTAVLPNVPLAYSYDAVGNRLSKTVGAATDTYAYNGASNRLSSITTQAGAARSFALDANGSTVNDGVNQYLYDARGRLVQSTGVTGATAYQVNALGQRIRKTNSTEDRVFLYDTGGRLITEATAQGQIKRNYIYLGDIPVAVIQ